MTEIDPKTRMEEKRNLPPLLVKVLEIDVQVTKKFVALLLNFLPMRSLRTHCKILEYSCHGIPWLVCWLAFCWMIDNTNLYQMQVNLFIGLLTDIVFVAVIKAATRRRRPAYNDDAFSIGPDKFSFPSGHTSRAVYLCIFFLLLDPVTFVLWPPILAWTVAVALSRLIMLRHHLLDILGGIILGIVNALLIYMIWFGQESCAYIISWMTDEKLSGADYAI